MMHLSAVKEVRIGPVRMGNRQRMVLMAGAVAAGDEATSVSIARSLKDLATSMRIQFVYRTRVAPSATEDILPVVDTLARIREEVEVPIIVNVSEPDHMSALANRVEGFIVPLGCPALTELVDEGCSAGVSLGLERSGVVPWELLAATVERSGDRGYVIDAGGGVKGVTADIADLPVLRALGVPLVMDALCCWNAGRGGSAFDSVHVARGGAAVGIDGIAFDAREDEGSGGDNALGVSEARDYLLCVLAIDRAVRGGARYV